MATVHLLCGFMGFGKTTIARQIAARYCAVRFTHDEVMTTFFGRTIPKNEFQQKYDISDKYIWDMAERVIAAGGSVVLDYGFWTREKRKKAFDRAKIFCENVTFHQIECDMETAKKRVLERSATDPNSLQIDAACFDALAGQYEPISPDEKYDVIYYRNC